MLISENTTTLAGHDDIVKTELLEILQVVVAAGGGLSAIHHILNKAKTMTDIRTRFAQWQTDRCTALPTRTPYPPAIGFRSDSTNRAWLAQ